MVKDVNVGIYYERIKNLIVFNTPKFHNTGRFANFIKKKLILKSDIFRPGEVKLKELFDEGVVDKKLGKYLLKTKLFNDQLLPLEDMLDYMNTGAKDIKEGYGKAPEEMGRYSQVSSTLKSSPPKKNYASVIAAVAYSSLILASLIFPSSKQKKALKIGANQAGYSNKMISSIQFEAEEVQKPITIQGENFYTVKEGDALWRIALETNTDINDLVKINKIKDYDLIHPEEKLIIPNQKVVRHKIEKDDWLSTIATKYNTTLEKLLDLNPQFVENPDLIYPGHYVIVSKDSETNNIEAKIDTTNLNNQKLAFNGTYRRILKDYNSNLGMKKIIKNLDGYEPSENLENLVVNLVDRGITKGVAYRTRFSSKYADKLDIIKNMKERMLDGKTKSEIIDYVKSSGMNISDSTYYRKINEFKREL